MAQYINKVDVIAEIEKLSAYLDSLHEQRIIEKILSIIDTLEVKEVDLEKEIKRWKNEHGVYGMDDLDFIFAKHFYELGLKTQKSATHKWNLQEK